MTKIGQIEESKEIVKLYFVLFNILSANLLDLPNSSPHQTFVICGIVYKVCYVALFVIRLLVSKRSVLVVEKT